LLKKASPKIHCHVTALVLPIMLPTHSFDPKNAGPRLKLVEGKGKDLPLTVNATVGGVLSQGKVQ